MDQLALNMFLAKYPEYAAYVGAAISIASGIAMILPPPTTDEIADGIELAQQYLFRLGVTAWQDAWVEPRHLAGYRLLAEQGRLIGRTIANHWWDRERGGEQIDEIVERRVYGTLGRLT